MSSDVNRKLVNENRGPRLESRIARTRVGGSSFVNLPLPWRCAEEVLFKFTV